ncbi:DUF3108 domain-containing protein [endosymbiont of Ridgeia piscesae]|jgi:hypothetical protein|uniref:DUF3108 domain-containing protein n=1 Tax=endosymbiont of Ridgeia piscesae TaxID=54398 RepID=A0A0T5Z0X4_9GAMM|nr:DUF3108 domain-containing protein [endosymbiont of Ridgeia piscesae]KRT56498.1 hypothetical protein Ga0074115_1501 [endosymbiont of Ridgeia piscesae]KRT57535.1 Protein of unknown function (DUF3108) [endosymbiont of Ridgeia piscesae]
MGGIKSGIKAALLGAFCFWLFGNSALAVEQAELWRYQISYQGILSGFMPMAIADAELRLPAQPQLLNGRPVRTALLQVSTAAYGKAELIYPLRYRYQSWFDPQVQDALLVKEELTTDQRQRELLWFDRQGRQAVRIEMSEPEPAGEPLPLQLDELLEGWQADGEQAVLSNRVDLQAATYDYYSLLQRLRRIELTEGEVLELPVFTGKALKRYRVEVASEVAGGGNLWRLRLASLDADGRPSVKFLLVWLTADERRIPLRFHAERPFGSLDAVLVGEGGESQIAASLTYHETEGIGDLLNWGD